jgi:hypothetical protein
VKRYGPAHQELLEGRYTPTCQEALASRYTEGRQSGRQGHFGIDHDLSSPLIVMILACGIQDSSVQSFTPDFSFAKLRSSTSALLAS